MSKKHNLKIPNLAKVGVEIVADPDGHGGVSWSANIEPGHSNHGHLQISAGEGAAITFDLQDNTDLGVRFDAAGPFFVADGAAGPCPTSMDSKQCMVDSCDADQLVVLDWNYGPACELHYQLNFVNEIGDPINPYDPIIQNTGGGVPPVNFL